MRTTSSLRRPIVRIGALLLCASGTAAAFGSEGDSAGVPAAQTLHCAMLTLDSHIDVPGNFATKDVDPGEAGEAQFTLPKMERGCLDAVFFVAAVGQNQRSAAHYRRAWDEAQRMIAGVHRMARQYPGRVAIARTADDVTRITAEGKHAALLGLENAYAIGTDLSRLSRLFDQGVRYITLTHTGHNAIADSSVPIGELGDTVEEHGGLSEFGRRVIAEMNRLGIMVDVSHTSKKTTLQAIAASSAPVIASHSAVRALADTPRNMDDEQLRLLAQRGGVVQVVGYSNYIKLNSAEKNRAIAEVEKELGLAGPMAWARASNSTLVAYGHRLVELDRRWPRAGVSDYVDHIDYIARKAGIDHVGIGSDFYAGGGAASGGLAGWMDVSEGVHVTEELLRRGYGREDIEKIWGGNLLRVLRETERVAGSATLQRFVVVANNEKVGALAATRRGDRLDIDFRVDENGRGARIRESMRLGPDGQPVEWDVEGKATIGAPVRESYRRRGRRASWRSLNDSGGANTDLASVYVANEASPWAYGSYLRALLSSPDHRLKALPTGELHAEKLRDITVGSAERAQPVSVYALWGIGAAPKLVLARADGEFFGTLDAASVIVPEGYESEFQVLSELASSLHREYLERLTKRLLHRFDQPLYVRNVRVFDSRSGLLGEPTTVIVFRNRIVGIRADAAPPADAVVVDGEGGTLLPGLTDMHSHVDSWELPLYLAGGVTSVRDLGGDNDALLELAGQTQRGTLMGPRMTLSGFLEGRSPFSARGGFVVDQLSTALEKVRWYADHGYWGIKIYSSMIPDWVPAIATEAHRLGLHISGHVPAFMTSERAVRAGYDEINHMNQLLLGFVLAEDEDTRTPLRFTAVGERMGKLNLRSEPVQRMVALMKERGTTVDVTMAGLEWLLLSQPGKSPPSIESWLSHMPGPVQRARRTAVLDLKGGQLPLYQASWKKLLEALKLLDDAGIRIVPGTDDVPGFMLHSELEVYGRAGIANARVLQIATIECARYLGREHELGSIEPGKLADFLLVDGNPLLELNATRKVRMVVKNGDVIFPEEVYSAMGIEPFAGKPPTRHLLDI